MYMRAGIALGAYLGQTRSISDRMLMSAAETLPTLVSQEDLNKGGARGWQEQQLLHPPRVGSGMRRPAGGVGAVARRAARDAIPHGRRALSMCFPTYAGTCRYVEYAHESCMMTPHDDAAGVPPAAQVLDVRCARPPAPAGLVYPRLDAIRDISARIALEVAKTAHAEGRLRGRAKDKLVTQGEEALLTFIKRSMFLPTYSSLVHLPPGILE